MSYDAWKTRSPDDEHDRGRSKWCEACDRARVVTEYQGSAMCFECAVEEDRRRHEEFLASLTIGERLRYAWGEWRWQLRWDVWPAIKRPFRAVRKWWRGHRRVPWEPDDDVPF